MSSLTPPPVGAATAPPSVLDPTAPSPAPVDADAQAQAAADRPDGLTAAKASPQVALSPAPVPAGSWQPLGPTPIGPPFLGSGGFYGGANSGRIDGLVAIQSGTHAGRVVAATAGGGVWTSDDTGTTWVARSDQAPSLAIGSVANDPSNADHLIAGTGEAFQCGDCYPGFGVLSSTDGGTNWANQNPGGVFTGRKISGVAIDPASSTHMFAATNSGLYVTSDGGSTWAKPSDPSYAAVDGNINGVVIDPVTSTTVYLSGGPARVAKSTDGGVHWAAANAGIGAPSGSSPFLALALAPSSPSTLYVSVGSTGAVGMYKTTNGGTTWATIPVPDFTGQGFSYGSGTGEQGWYDNVVAVDPLNANHVLAGGIALVETVNGGANWTNINSKTFFAPGTNKIHPDHHALAFRPDGKVWVGDDGGVFLYNPAANTVVNANGNLNITQFRFGFNEVGGVLLAGAQDNGVARTNSPSLSAWTGVRVGDGGPSAIVPNSPSVQFIVGNQDLFRTNDAFATTQRNITPPDVGLFTSPMTISANAGTPADPTVFYGGPDLWRSTNTSVSPPTWTKVTSIGQFVTAIAVSPSNSQVVYVGFKNGVIQVSTDGGVSFASLATQPFPTTFVTGLSVDPTNPQAITASVSTSDTRSSIGAPHVAQYSYTGLPGSGSWTTITGNLPSSKAVSRVVYDNGALVAATDAGVYATGTVSGSSTSWSLVGSGLPAVQVQDLFVDPGSANLYAVTHGRGAWMLAVSTKASPTISTQASGSNLLGAPVRDTATLTGGSSPTSSVTFRLFSDNTCATQVFTSTNPLSGLTAKSDWFTPATVGTYWWTALYNGDGNNNTAASPCLAPNESVVISPFVPPPCTLTLTGDVQGPVTANSGDSVCITNARVIGPVTVNGGGALTVVSSQISSGVVADNPNFLSLCDSQVSGPSPSQALGASNATVPIRIGDPANGCAGNRFAGEVNLTSNLAVTFGANIVSNNVNVNTNGPGNSVIKANNVFQALACAGNNPAPTNAGQVNTAASKSGQCLAL